MKKSYSIYASIFVAAVAFAALAPKVYASTCNITATGTVQSDDSISGSPLLGDVYQIQGTVTANYVDDDEVNNSTLTVTAPDGIHTVTSGLFLVNAHVNGLNTYAARVAAGYESSGVWVPGTWTWALNFQDRAGDTCTASGSYNVSSTFDNANGFLRQYASSSANFVTDGNEQAFWPTGLDNFGTIPALAYVNVSGTDVSYVSGTPFLPQTLGANTFNDIYICTSTPGGCTPYWEDTINSSTDLTLTTSGGNLNDVKAYLGFTRDGGPEPFGPTSTVAATFQFYSQWGLNFDRFPDDQSGELVEGTYNTSTGYNDYNFGVGGANTVDAWFAAAHAEGFHLVFGGPSGGNAPGPCPSFSCTTTEEQNLQNFYAMISARWGAFYDILELTNETNPSQAWTDDIGAVLTSGVSGIDGGYPADPYGHFFTNSWGTNPTYGPGTATPDSYLNINDLAHINGLSGYPIYSWMGNSETSGHTGYLSSNPTLPRFNDEGAENVGIPASAAGTPSTPAAPENELNAPRIVDETNVLNQSGNSDFSSQQAFMTFATTTPGLPETSWYDAYNATALLQNFMKNLDPAAVPISLTLGGGCASSNCSYSALGSSSHIRVALDSNTGNSTTGVPNPVASATIAMNVPQLSMTGQWWNTATGAILSTVTTSATTTGSQTFAVPNFNVDMWFQLDTSSTLPSITSFTASPGVVAAAGTSTLSWNITNASSVAITPGTFSTSTLIASTTVNPTSTIVYTITATNANGTSTATTSVQVATAPTAPGSFTVGTPTTSTLSLAWASSTPNNGATISFYSIYRGAASTSISTFIASTTNLSYTNTGLATSTTYWYDVVAQDSAGNVSASSTNASGTTLSGSTSGITFDASTSIAGTSATSLNKSITVGSGFNEGLFIQIAGRCAVTGVTVGGNPATLAYAPTSTLGNPAYQYYYLGLPSGSVSVTSTCSGASNYAMGISSFFGINQTHPIDATSTEATGSATLPSNTITTAVANDLLIDAIGWQIGSTSTPSTGQTEIAAAFGGSCPGCEGVYSSYKIATSTQSYTMSWTSATAVWQDNIVAYEPSSGTLPSISSFTASPGVVAAAGTSTLSWNITNASSVAITPGTFSTSTLIASTTVNPTSTIVYTITATNANGTSTATTSVQVATAPTAPGSFTVGTPTTSTLSLAWASSTPNNGATISFYSIYRGAASTSISTFIASTTNLSYTNTGLATSTTYWYDVVAQDSAGNVSASSTNASGTTLSGVLPSITSFTASPGVVAAAGTSTLSWNITNASSVAITPGTFSTSTLVASTTVNPTSTTVYTITATNANGTSTATTTVQVATAPTAPGSFTVGTPTTSTLSLSWASSTPNNGATISFYSIYRGAASTSISTFIASTTNLSYTNTGLATSTTYWYDVVAQDSVGNVSASSTNASGTTLSGVLPSITSFTASPGVVAAAGTSTLSWNITNASSVAITPGTFSTSTLVASTTVNPTSTTVYTITATNANGTSTATTTVQVATAPTAPGSFTVGTPTTSTLSLSWASSTPNNGATISFYSIYRGAASTSISTFIASTTNLSYTNTGLATSTTYWYDVVAQDSAGNVSASSTNASGTTLSGVLPSITSFTASPGVVAAAGTSTLSWNITNASSVAITPGTFSTSTLVASTTVNPTSTTVYTITATNANGTSTATTTVQVATAPTAPGSFTVGTPTTSTLSLSWASSTPNNGATISFYSIYRGAASTSISTFIASTTNLSYTNTGLATSTTYWYDVVAQDSVGNVSASSTNASGTTLSGVLPSITSFTASPGVVAAAGTSTLSWNITNASSVAITPGTFSTSTLVASTTVNPTSTTVYTITATNANGTSTATTTVQVATAPTAPGSFTVGTPTTSTLSLSWASSTPNNGATISFYSIYRGAASTSISTFIASTTNLSYTNTGLATSTTYWYDVVAQDSVGNVSASSTNASGTTLSGVLPSITSFTASPGVVAAAGTSTLSWNITNASSVAITPGTFSTSTLVASTTVNPTSTTVYTITATNANGTSTATTTVSIITTPVISAVSSGTPNTTSATITWTTSPAADSQVYYGTSTAYTASSSYNASDVTSHSVTLTGLASLTTYHFEVLSSDGILATSSDMTFTTASAGVPTASSVMVTGTTTVGDVLTGSYSFSDPNNEPESGSTYQWFRAATSGGSYSVISGATSSTYTLVSADIGHYLEFQVTPASLSGTGSAALSSATAEIDSASPPTATSVAITGTPTEGDTLTGSYTYSQANGVAEGASTYVWLEASSSGGSYSAIPGATGDTYALGPSDVGQYLEFQVTPVATYPPATGTVQTSAPTGAIAPSSLPVASNVAIAGTATIGQLLTGSYTYSDSGSHPEASSTYAWYEATSSNGTYGAITNATGTTYTLAASDVGKYLKFQVTPVSTVATGNPVQSAASTQIQNSGAPTATSVAITGTATEGDTLTGSYSFSDPNSFAEASSSYQWIEATSSNGTYANISGATAKTYVLLSSDVGKYLEFQVTPVASVPPMTGNPAVSAATGAIAPSSIPVASNVAIAGTAAVGQLLTGSYTYSDAGSHPEASSTYAWLEATTSLGTYAPIAGATSLTYTPTSTDAGQYLKFQVTPVSTVAVGSASASAPTAPIPAVTIVITSVTAGSIGTNGATITWTTNVPADSTVSYGITASYGSTSTDPTLVTSHSIALSGLGTATIYHVAVMSSVAGTSTTSGDTTFTTNAVSAPVVVNEGGGGGGTYIPSVTTTSTTTTGTSTGITTTTTSVTIGSTPVTIPTTQAGLASLLESLQVQLQTLLTQAADEGIIVSTSTLTTGGGASSVSTPPSVSGSGANSGSGSGSVRDLMIGMSGADVRQLQRFLMREHEGPAAANLTARGATGYFGVLTKAALIEFQKRVGIVPASGYFGPITRAWIYTHDLEVMD